MRPSPATPESPFKGRVGWRRLVRATFTSIAGLAGAWRTEAAFRQEVWLAAVLAPVALVLPLSALERVVLWATLVLMLVVELLNSGIEAAVDRISLENHELSKRAKDLGSAAVMLALALVALAWLAIAGPAVLAALGSR